MCATTIQQRKPTTGFDSLYQELVSVWLSHQRLKTTGAPLPDLATSNSELFEARVALGNWHRHTGS